MTVPVWLELTVVALYYIVGMPIVYVFRIVQFILHALAIPFLRLGAGLWYLCLVPVRIMGRFENLLYFLGAAVVVGLLLGGLLHLTSATIINFFSLSVPLDERSRRYRRRDATPIHQASYVRPYKMGRSSAPRTSLTTPPANQGRTPRHRIQEARDPKALAQEYKTWLKQEDTIGAERRLARGLPLTSTIILEEASSDSDDTVLWS